jgi:hypothetical protein
MANKLGTIDIPEEMRAGLRLFTRLEGERSATKLVEDAASAYLKVIRTVIEKDSAIQDEVAKELAPKKRVSKVTATAG